MAHFVDHLKAQHAGEIGLLAFGLGKEVTSKYNFDFMYGYSPESETGIEIETYAFKNQYHLTFLEYKEFIFTPYIGAAIYHVIGLKYQTSRNASYPRNYYRMSSLRILLYSGFEVMKFTSKYSGFFEAGMNDIWIINYLNNSDIIDPKDYISLAIGFKYYIN